MKIALISRRFPPLIGGAEKVLSYLAPALAAEGATVTVLTAKPPGLEVPETETHVPSGRNATGRVDVVRLSTSRLRFLGTWIYMRNLSAYLRANPPDVAYVSMLKHDAYVAVAEGARRGFPVVLRPEGAGATGDIAWQGWGRFGGRIAERCKLAAAFVSISPSVTDELKHAGYDASKIHAIPNGVPVPEPAWQRRQGWRESPRAVFVGRLAREKGLDTLLNAWPTVLESFPKARLMLIGEGPERPALTAQAARLGVSSSVELPGAVDDPVEVLRGSDLFVLPSREEGMSIALLEAMALGIPAVATSIAGNRRLIQEFKHGRLAPVDDPAGLARVMVDQWTHFDRAFHMTRAARKRVQDEFSIRAMAKKHLELFRGLTASGPNLLSDRWPPRLD
ncbi:MAG: glycosyltransferase family 4 protein [Isosphaeraceae bacterium]